MQTKSVRLPEHIIGQVQEFCEGLNFSEVMTEAIEQWLDGKRREREDGIIVRSLSQRSAKQRKEEASLLKAASESGQRVAERSDG